VLFARVKLTMATDPAVERPAVAQANLDLNGRLIRAQATGADMREAVNRMSGRLRMRLLRAARNWAAIRAESQCCCRMSGGIRACPHRACPTSPAPGGTQGDPAQGVHAGPPDPDEAVTDLELLDCDFYLFTERATGQDSVIYRTATRYRLAQARPRPGRLGPGSGAITVSEHPAPKLTLASAMARLEALGQPFLFFVTSETRRGNLIYHRYDGKYGVITPAGS
jgi:hypothetical protein